MTGMKKFVVRIFDGKYTTIYTVEDINKSFAEEKIVNYHKALGNDVVKVTTTERG